MKLTFDQVHSYMTVTEYTATKEFNEQILDDELHWFYGYRIFNTSDGKWCSVRLTKNGGMTLNLHNSLDDAKEMCRDDFNIFLRYDYIGRELMKSIWGVNSLRFFR